MAGAVTRSHLPDGRCVGWFGETGPGLRVAVDAELDHRPPSALARRFGEHDFWERWTRAECAAKLADVPIAVWLRRHGLADAPGLGYRFETCRPVHLDPRLVVSVATVRT